jgi:hypothetical protein
VLTGGLVVDEAASDGEVWRDGDAGGETKLRRMGRRSGETGTPEGGLARARSSRRDAQRRHLHGLRSRRSRATY